MGEPPCRSGLKGLSHFPGRLENRGGLRARSFGTNGSRSGTRRKWLAALAPGFHGHPLFHPTRSQPAIKTDLTAENTENTEGEGTTNQTNLTNQWEKRGHHL